MKANKGHELRADVLGQLLLMQSIICNLPDEKSIFSFTCRGLIDLPGIQTAVHVREQKPERDGSRLSFPLCSGDTDFGSLVLTVDDYDLFAPYKDYVNNFCFMIAVILEERCKSQKNKELCVQLEKRVEDRSTSLRESREQFHAVFKSTSDALIIADESGSLVEANEAAASMFGYTPEELLGLQVIIVANLKPAKLMGVTSQGMVLAAKEVVDGRERMVLTTVRNSVAVGTKVA